jgi:hypothetical protein
LRLLVERWLREIPYGSTHLLGLDRFCSSLIYTQSVGLLGREISPSQGRYLHAEQHKHRINAHRHPCLEWDSKAAGNIWKWAHLQQGVSVKVFQIISEIFLVRSAVTEGGRKVKNCV